jgi:uncharacterized membrane protein SpoIIM required for sporulation
MNEPQFIEKNKETWQSLEAFNNRLVRSGVQCLNRGEVRSFARLLRLTGYHLAYAKTHFPAGLSVPYLNNIVGVAHNYFFIRENRGASEIKRYFLHVFPQAAYENRHYFLVSAVLFFIGVFFAAVYIAGDPSLLGAIMPQVFGEMGEGFGAGPSQWDHSLMSAVIMTNNISVSITAFALGITAGLGTVYVLVYNGLIVGGLYGFLSATGGDLLQFYALILPHGVLELAAIFLSGAGGLMIGRGLLIPGPYSRKHALVMQAKKAALLIPGIAAILVLAGLIEGFFTPLPISPWFKLAFAGLTGLGLVFYFKHTI